MANQAFATTKMGNPEKGEIAKPFMVEDKYLEFVKANAEIKYEHIKTYYQKKQPLLRELIFRFYNKRQEIKGIMKKMDRSADG